MGGLGWHNPFPMELGGGPTEIELVYFAMRGAVGKGGSARNDETSIDGLWRQCRARILAQIATADERALLQAFPITATDSLPYWEDLLRLPPDPESSEAERRSAVSARYTSSPLASVPAVSAALQALDSRLTVLVIPEALTDTTEPGRGFEDLAAAEPFVGRKSSRYPNFSTRFVWRVRFAIGAGITPGPIEIRVIQLASELMDDLIPAWNDFTIQTDDGDGFDLDLDLLDYTGLQ